MIGAGTAALGAVLFVASAPGAGRAPAFWHPLRAMADARAPVRLAVDHATVRRGDSVTVTLEVPAATRAILWTRGPGEPWRGAPIALDSLGRAARRLGPLESDLYLRASSGSRRSVERRVSVALPAFLAGLELTARYPEYLARPDEPLVPGPDLVAIPEGSVILTSGTASVALTAAAWRRETGPAGRAHLAVDGARFSGRLPAPPSASGTWLLELAAADGTPLEGDVPQLRLRVVPDSAPVVTVPIPGRDTTLPLSLKQPLVIDARDDHGLTRLEVVSWRASQTGKQGAAVRASLDVSGAGERAIVQGDLDAEGRGLLPGDTLRLRVEAWDNVPAPGTHMGRSAEIALRLPSLEELRAATRAAARDVAAAADSLAQAERELGTRTRELAARLRELQEALARLDPEATRRALERLAEAQQLLKDQLERSQELFRRAAVEGALASLAADAEDLQRRQAEWNREDASRPDSAGATRQRTLADRADSLARGIERVATDLRAGSHTALATPQQAARAARAAMQRAAQAAQEAQAAAATEAGTEAEQQLAGVPEALRGQRDSLAREWRGETLAALDPALSETAALAQGQQGVAEALRRGEAGAATRSRQASVEEGTDAVARQIREAAGKHALVSPQLDAALGYAKRQMAAARSELEEADPNASEAAALADDAVDALNATALALARSRSQVAGGKSGSGFAEAVEQLARLARDQQGLNGLAQGLFPLMGVSGAAMLQRLQALAARQRALAEQLERLQAGGASAAAGPLAQEAKELARQLDAGRLDQQTIERDRKSTRLKSSHDQRSDAV